jgi:NAD(P)-dependent dehydrogenase (short-subunit alcohol dehydrogenase family)
MRSHSVQKAAEDTSAITSGSLDYIIANAGLVPTWSAFDPFSVLGQDPVRLTQELTDCFTTNVIGNVHLFNAFMPLVLKGTGKKVVTLGTGLSDLDLTVRYQFYEGAPYSVSKTAMNMVTAKFQAEYQKDGVLFADISPGFVNTGQYDNSKSSCVSLLQADTNRRAVTEEEQKKLGGIGAKFAAYAPHFTAPITPEESVKAVLEVMKNLSLENGNAGAFVSHYGNKQWL